MKIFNNSLNIVIGAAIGVFIGSTAFRCWQFHTHPQLFAMQSAPWYVGIWVDAALAAVVVLAAVIIKLLLHKRHNKQH